MLLGSLLDDLLGGLLDDLSLGLGLGGLLLGHAHEDVDRGRDLTVEVDLDGVLAGGLDVVAAADALAVDLQAELGLDGLGDLSGAILASTVTDLPSRAALVASAAAMRSASRFSML